MVVGNIETAKRYFMLNKSFAKVFEFLKTIDRNTDVGVFEFEEFKVTICEIETIALSEKETENKLEAHKKYIDIHYVLDGFETVGYANIDALQIVNDYNADEDYMLLTGQMKKITLSSGEFCIVFPEDAHAPGRCLCDKGRVKKAIVKIK